MAAPGFAFLLFFTIMSGTIGSDLEQSSVASILDSIQALKQEMADLKESIQADNEQTLIYTLDKMAALQKEFRALLSNLSSRVEQLEDFQNSCFGEQPSLQNGRPLDFERKHGSDVQYRCDVDFVQAGNSTVRCHFGKWEGKPPLCTRPAISPVNLDKLSLMVDTISCSDDENDQQVHFSRLQDTGRGWALPTAARTYTRGGVAILDLSDVPRPDRRGLFRCGHGNRTSMTFLIDGIGFFVRPRVASVGDAVELGTSVDAPFWRWLRDGQRVPEWDGRRAVQIAAVQKEDAGFYERYREGDRRGAQWFFRLVVRGCPAGFFGEACDRDCPTCYNGGLCHEKLGTCVCSPGFKGRRCEVACGKDRIGNDCSEACDGGDCLKQIFCQQDPYGCSCVPGYKDYHCTARCDGGKFGADCKQTCRCREGPCDPYTGACSGGCSEGWTGASCQIPGEN